MLSGSHLYWTLFTSALAGKGEHSTPNVQCLYPVKKPRTSSNTELSSSCQAQTLFLIVLRCRNCYTSSFTSCSALLSSLQNAPDMIEWGILSEIWNLLQHTVKMEMNDADVEGQYMEN